MSHAVNIGPAFRNSFTLHFCSAPISMIPCPETADAWGQEVLDRFHSLNRGSVPLVSV